MNNIIEFIIVLLVAGVGVFFCTTITVMFVKFWFECVKSENEDE